MIEFRLRASDSILEKPYHESIAVSVPVLPSRSRERLQLACDHQCMAQRLRSATASLSLECAARIRTAATFRLCVLSATLLSTPPAPPTARRAAFIALSLVWLLPPLPDGVVRIGTATASVARMASSNSGELAAVDGVAALERRRSGEWYSVYASSSWKEIPDAPPSGLFGSGDGERDSLLK